MEDWLTMGKLKEELGRLKAYRYALGVLALGMALLDNNLQLRVEDSIQRAWDFTVDWIGSNKAHFSSILCRGLPRYGSIAPKHVNIIQSVYRKALEDAGFSYAKSVKGFVSRGLFDSFTDADGKKRSQYQCKIDGVNMRVFRCNLAVQDNTCEEFHFPNSTRGTGAHVQAALLFHT